MYGPGDAIAGRRGQVELLRSRLHTGTGARVQRVLQKAMGGAPITISVLGGSGMCPVKIVSLCGCNADAGKVHRYDRS